MTASTISMSAEEILVASRKYVGRKDGWQTGGLGFVDGQVCALGALGWAAGNTFTVNSGVGIKIHADEPINDDNGQYAAVESLMEAIPESKWFYSDQVLKNGEGKRYFKYMKDNIWRYNDSLKHQRTATKWFDRAIALQRAKDGPNKIIEQAIKVLDQRWTEGQIGGPNSQVCAIGGIVAAMDNWATFSGSQESNYQYPTSATEGYAASGKTFVAPDSDLGLAIKKVATAIPENKRHYLSGEKLKTASIDELVDAIVDYNDGHLASYEENGTLTGKIDVLAWFKNALKA